ncbi:MAG: diaminopropionate ammonia-lyase [candidate division Zixibacteria bacterium]|nr:diaminopropionate ammonia-lyase [candidate division Zixibacteria bacterium]
MCRYIPNPYRQNRPAWSDHETAAFRQGDIRIVHRSLAEYLATPLVELPRLAKSLKVGNILVKNESYRFGLKAFKALGSTYAIYRQVRDHLMKAGDACPDAASFYRKAEMLPPNTFTFCTATDGNHGRGVAWAARKLHQKAVIFMPSGTVPARIDAIRAEGAEVVVVDGNYDLAVQTAIRETGRNQWLMISDTSWPGYDTIPRDIMAGYVTMFEEIDDVVNERPDVIFVQSGVGALAATASWYYNHESDAKHVQLVSVEPPDAACLLESIDSPNGEPVTCRGAQKSIMAGLNCGTPSIVAWPFIRSGFDVFLTVPDEYSLKAMRRYYYPETGDRRIVSGESGAAGLAALLALSGLDTLQPAGEVLGLTTNSTVLLLNTEGDTDPAHFAEVISSA